MTKTIATVLAAVVALAGATVALADHKPGHPAKPQAGQGKAKGKQKAGKPAKVQVCHRTLSEKNPTRTIRISERAWPAHERHGDTQGACDEESAPPQTTRLTADLSAVAGASGSGTAVLDVRVKKRNAIVRFTLNVSGVDATAAHIHTSTAMTLGAASFAADSIVVPLKTPNGDGVARGSKRVSRAVGLALLNQTASFYVNVHSAAFPNGQVQGTLAKS